MTDKDNDIDVVQVRSTIEQEILPIADELEEVFKRVSRTIEEEMARAAKSGAVSFKSMVEEIINDLTRLAVEEYVKAPIEQAILNALGRQGGNKQASSAPFADQLSKILRENG